MVRLLVLIVLEFAAVVLLSLRLAAPIAEAAPAASTQPAVDAALPSPTAERIDTVAAPPAAAAPAPITPQRDEVAAPWQADDPVGVLLTGSVCWTDGTPVAEPNVYLHRDRQYVAVDASAGTFAACGLAPGSWEVSVRADNAVDIATTLDLTGAALQTHDFVLERSFPVKVRIVTKDGEDGTMALRKARLWGADLHVVGRRERFPDRMAPTDYGVLMVGDAKWDGEMNPKDGFAGTLQFAAAPPNHVALLLRHLVVDQQVVAPGQGEVTFTIDPEAVRALTGAVTVRVLDADSGAPLQASVGLNSSNRGGPGQKTDDDGRATVENLPPGLLRLEVRAGEHENLLQMVAIAPGQRLDLGDLRLGPVVSLTGRVLDADGKPCATASLQWTELKWRTAPTEFINYRTARSEADGTFQLWGTGLGRIAVRARGADGSLATGVFDNPPTTPIDLHLAPPATLKVRRPDDLTKAYTVTLLDVQRQPVAAQTLEPRVHEDSILMPPGTYGYEVHDEANRLLQSGSVTLGGQPANLEIR